MFSNYITIVTRLILFAEKNRQKMGNKSSKNLPKIMASEACIWVSQSVIMELLEDTKLKVTEELFSGIIKWCRANTDTELEAIDKFRNHFAAKILGKNKKEKLPLILASEAWLWLPESMVMELMEETNLEGTDLKTSWIMDGVIQWCRANTDTEQAAIDKFQQCFGNKIVIMNKREKLTEFMASEAWLWLPEKLVMELVEDTNINASEGQLFTGIIKWCRANFETEQKAIDKFKMCFADSIFGKKISRRDWLEVFLPQEKFIPSKQFRQWTSEIIKNNCEEATLVNQEEIENTSSAFSGDQEEQEFHKGKGEAAASIERGSITNQLNDSGIGF